MVDIFSLLFSHQVRTRNFINMPSTHLTRGISTAATSPLVGTGRLNTLMDRLLCLLEKVSDEAFWNGLFGDRVLNLLKRYFGSDVVFLGFIVYLARKFILCILHL